jgi:hypothetical protein
MIEADSAVLTQAVTAVLRSQDRRMVKLNPYLYSISFDMATLVSYSENKKMRIKQGVCISRSPEEVSAERIDSSNRIRRP